MSETMPSPPSDDTKNLFKLLFDGKWHNFYEIKEAVAATVPPGRALRKYQNDIESRRRAKKDPNYDVPHNDDVRIELGKRRCAQAVMSAWLKDEKKQGVEVRGEGPTKEIRIRPGFVPPWGVRELMEASDSVETGAVAQDPPFEGQGYTDLPTEGFRGSEVLCGTAEEASVSEPVAVDPAPARAFVLRDGEWIPADQLPTLGTVVAEAREETPIFELGPTVEPEQSPEAVLGPHGMVVPSQAVFPSGHSASSYDWPLLPPSQDPGCTECGLAVRDQSLHESWHEQFVKRNELESMALLTESQLVDLCRDVMGQELDRFQGGMQLWLEKQFAQVAMAISMVRESAFRWTANDAWRSPKGDI